MLSSEFEYESELRNPSYSPIYTPTANSCDREVGRQASSLTIQVQYANYCSALITFKIVQVRPKQIQYKSIFPLSGNSIGSTGQDLTGHSTL